MIACAEAGADGYVTVDATLDDLERAIAHIGQEELLCSPRIAATLFRCLAHGNGRVAEAAADNMLTPREREIWKCIGGGLSNKEIAGALNISVLTVKNHVHHLLRKLNVSTRIAGGLQAQLAVAESALLPPGLEQAVKRPASVRVTYARAGNPSKLRDFPCPRDRSPL